MFVVVFDVPSYFAALVDSYTRVLLPPKNIADKFKTLELRDKTVIMDKAMSYMEFEVAQENARKKAEEEQESERGIFSHCCNLFTD
jgi:hypothetical protein